MKRACPLARPLQPSYQRRHPVSFMQSHTACHFARLAVVRKIFWLSHWPVTVMHVWFGIKPKLRNLIRSHVKKLAQVSFYAHVHSNEQQVKRYNRIKKCHCNKTAWWRRQAACFTVILASHRSFGTVRCECWQRVCVCVCELYATRHRLVRERGSGKWEKDRQEGENTSHTHFHSFVLKLTAEGMMENQKFSFQLIFCIYKWYHPLSDM